MHMSDALVSPAVGAVMYVASGAGIAVSAKKLHNEEEVDNKIPLMAVSAAFVFAAQMINFTIPGTGSSGHIGGGILLSAVLGPAPALISIASVLIIQCLMFADGGLLALGCNIFNMGVIPCLIIYPFVFRPIAAKTTSYGRLVWASILSAVLAMQLGAFMVVIDTLISGVTALPFGTFLLLMQPIHLAIGLVEGIVTAAVVSYIRKTRPEILDSAIEGNSLDVSVKKTAIVLLVAAIIVGGGVSLFASSNPDGLEWSIFNITDGEELEANGDVYEGAESIVDQTAAMPDYEMKENNPKNISIPGIIGGLVTLVVAGGVGFIISRKRKKLVTE